MKTILSQPKRYLFLPGRKQWNFEFKTVDDKLVNDDRSFDVEIADVKGASIGENKRLTVTIKDNDSSFYETLSGNLGIYRNGFCHQCFQCASGILR